MSRQNSTLEEDDVNIETQAWLQVRLRSIPLEPS